MWSLYHVLKASKDLIDGSSLLWISNLQSLEVIGLGEVEIYPFLFVTWLHVAT